jgi:hypothetical protein
MAVITLSDLPLDVSIQVTQFRYLHNIMEIILFLHVLMDQLQVMLELWRVMFSVIWLL